MSDDKPSVGLAIVTMDRFEDTVETLLQLDLTRFEEVVVVDDSEANELENWCSKHQSISYQRGPGQNMQAARNVAIGFLCTDVITFLDDDVYCPDDFANRVRDRFDEDKNLVAAGGPCPPVMSKTDYGVCDFSSLCISRIGTIYGDASKLMPDRPLLVDSLKGANMSFRREPLEDIGGFDTKYGGHSQREETDVFVRISELGEICLDPNLVCYHKEKGDDFSPGLFTWRFRNHGRFIRKNFGLTAAILSFFSIFVRLCGSPESIYQLLFGKYVQKRPIPIMACIYSYLRGASETD